MVVSDEVRDLMAGSKEYLQNNDLNGFYNDMCDHMVDLYDESGQYNISEVTWTLAFCDIDFWNAFDREGAIPPFFAIDNSVPGQLIDTNKNMLKLPPNVKSIGYRAFYNAGNFTVADLTNIEFIEEEAFGYSYLATIILGDASINYFLNVARESHIQEIFYESDLCKILLPKKYEADEDLQINLLKKFEEAEEYLEKDIEIGFY